MTTTLSKGKSHFNLNANEDFVMFLTSKLVTCFIDEFTSRMKSQSIAYLLSGSARAHTHIYGFCGQVVFKNTRAMFFQSRAGHKPIFNQE